MLIYDDGRRANLNGSINFDDEGVPSSRTLLIDRGRLVGYMHSRETAARMRVPLTGNGRRQAFNYPPLPRMTNTYLENGETLHEEIIRSVKSGIYARAFAGGSVNITTGDFTFVPTEAYLIEDGRLTAPLANVMLLGNGPENIESRQHGRERHGDQRQPLGVWQARTNGAGHRRHADDQGG